MQKINMFRTIQSSHINFFDHWYLQEFENQVVGDLSLDHRTLPYSFIFTVGKLHKYFEIAKYLFAT